MTVLTSLQRSKGVVQTLVAGGFNTWIYAPGSRCAPLGYVLCQLAEAGEIDLHVRVDERDAAFMALGSGRGGYPAVVVMTSGTAVGNALPAVMEAHHAQVPLVVLSADRPAGLRGVGANQTTIQTSIFANFVRFETDLQPECPWESQLNAVREAVRGALGGMSDDFPYRGPAHINLSLAEPLAPSSVVESFMRCASEYSEGEVEYSSGVSAGGGDATVLTGSDTSKKQGFFAGETTSEVGRLEGTVLVAGDSAPFSPVLCDVLRRYRIPVWAEPQTPWRSHPNTVLAYAKVAAGELSRGIRRVVVLGRPTLTRAVTATISREDVPVEVLDTAGDQLDLAGNVARRWSDLGDLIESLHLGETAWLDAWQLRGRAQAEQLSAQWGVHQAVAAIWQTPENLYLGASLTIRAFDAVAGIPLPCPTAASHPNQDVFVREGRVFTNRGLAGIDGTIASAWGAALATKQATRVVLGDISFFHDLGQLQCAALEEIPDLQVIVLNNGGGRIFEFLEHGQAQPQVFQRMFLTPQSAQPVEVAAALGWDTHQVSNLDELRACLDCPVRGLQLLEVRLP